MNVATLYLVICVSDPTDTGIQSLGKCDALLLGKRKNQEVVVSFLIFSLKDVKRVLLLGLVPRIPVITLIKTRKGQGIVQDR